ncbi:PagK family vesicle-borne virulence factor [Salmonella enterica]
MKHVKSVFLAMVLILPSSLYHLTGNIL